MGRYHGETNKGVKHSFQSEKMRQRKSEKRLPPAIAFMPTEIMQFASGYWPRREIALSDDMDMHTAIHSFGTAIRQEPSVGPPKGLV